MRRTPTKRALEELRRKKKKADSMPLLCHKSTLWGYGTARMYKRLHVARIEAELELVEKGYLRIIEQGDYAYFELTEGGEVEVLKESIREVSDDPNGVICAVSFDIPEDVRYLRDSFRHFLKSVGFIMKQQSLWISPKPVQQPLRQLTRALKISDWVEIYTFTNLNPH